MVVFAYAGVGVAYLLGYTVFFAIVARIARLPQAHKVGRCVFSCFLIVADTEEGGGRFAVVALNCCFLFN